MSRAAESVGPFCIVFFVVMMNAALIGMNFFAGKIGADYTWHYDTPFWAMATTFQVRPGRLSSCTLPANAPRSTHKMLRRCGAPSPIEPPLNHHHLPSVRFLHQNGGILL